MEKEQRFFAHAGQVLKFDLFWDDRGAWAGQRNVYVMHYYLADDAVEIRTRPQPGFDKFPCLLKRSKLPKNWEAARRGSKPEYFNFRELRTGETVNVFGREMLIIDCDAFTKDFYRYNFRSTLRSRRRPRSSTRCPSSAKSSSRSARRRTRCSRSSASPRSAATSTAPSRTTTRCSAASAASSRTRSRTRTVASC